MKNPLIIAFIISIFLTASGVINEFLYEFNDYEALGLYLIGGALFIKLVESLKAQSLTSDASEKNE